MICANCKQELLEGSSFCTNCGLQVTEFSKYALNIRNRIDKASVLEECQNIRKETFEKLQNLMSDVTEDGHQEQTNRNINLFLVCGYELAKKFYTLDDGTTASAIIKDLEAWTTYCTDPDVIKEVKEKIQKLKTDITNGTFSPVPSPDSTVQPDSKVQPDSTVKSDSTGKSDSTVKSDPTVKPDPTVPDPEKEKKKSNKVPIIAAIVVLIIAAGGFFVLGGNKGEKKPIPVTGGSSVTEPVKDAKVQEVAVSFVVPEGTKVVWDSKDVSGKNELKVSVGTHDVQLQHPLLEFDYDKKINISTPGQKSLYKGVKNGPNLKSVAEKVNQNMMNDILKQACTSDAVVVRKPIFIENAVVTEGMKIAHSGFRSFAVENKVNSFRPVEIVSSELREPIVGDNGKTSIKSKSVFSVQLTESDKAKYVIETTLAIQGEQVAVSSFDQIRDGE